MIPESKGVDPIELDTVQTQNKEVINACTCKGLNGII